MPEGTPPYQLRNQLVHVLLHLQRAGISYLPNPDPLIRDVLRERLGGTTVTPERSQVSQRPPAINPKGVLENPAPLFPEVAQMFPEAAQFDSSQIGGADGWNTSSLGMVERSKALAVLNQTVASCQRCELSRTRRSTVFGEGNPMPRICFFGEAPGADEDRSGRPFVGAAGQLLDRIILASGLKRDEVYILNTVKCRPPENRNPTNQEIEHCRGYFESQFEILRPEFIVCLGLVAAKSILKDAPSIGQLRGRLHRYRGAQVVVTYHPSYLLRTPSAKKATWDDMKMLLISAGLPIPSKS